jgi:hypothetical protein
MRAFSTMLNCIYLTATHDPSRYNNTLLILKVYVWHMVLLLQIFYVSYIQIARSLAKENDWPKGVQKVNHSKTKENTSDIF